MYGVILCFDHKTEQQITQIWNGLAKANISTYHIDKNGRQKRPHLTLADYHGLDIQSFEAGLRLFCQGKKPFEIDLSILGSFPSGGTLFLTPVMSKELLTFHSDYHRDLNSFQDHDDSFYLPGRWVPHCTIANHLKSDLLTQAFNWVSQSFQSMKAQVSEIEVIKLIIENGMVMGTDTILTFSL